MEYVNYSYIYSRFSKTRKEQRDIYASWPAQATRRQLTNEYWCNALCHYSLLFVLADVVVLLYGGQWNVGHVPADVMLGMGAYIPLYFLLYRPIFTIEFLPKPETVIAIYEGRERAWQEKCKLKLLEQQFQRP